MLSIPTDCPQREKAGWIGDISLYAKTALLNEDVTPIFGWLVVDKMAQAAATLGRDAGTARYRTESAVMKQAIQAALITADGVLEYERQGAYVLMLAFGLVPDRLVHKFGTRLAEIIHENGDRLDTGFMPTPYLLDALCIGGQRNLAYTLLYQTKFPSWLAQIKRGTTTIWESWEMYLPDGTPKKESFNHYTYGTVDDWIFRTIGGIDQDDTGYRHLVIHPQPDVSLTWAKRSFETENGPVRVEWERKGGQFILAADIPCNTDAVIFCLMVQSMQQAAITIHLSAQNHKEI